MQMLRLADFVNMNQATNAQPNNLPLTDDEKTLTYEQFTQQLIDNIAQRHAGEIPLRELAPKQDR